MVIERRRAVVLLRDVDGWGAEEVSAALGVSLDPWTGHGIDLRVACRALVSDRAE